LSKASATYAQCGGGGGERTPIELSQLPTQKRDLLDKPWGGSAGCVILLLLSLRVVTTYRKYMHIFTTPCNQFESFPSLSSCPWTLVRVSGAVVLRGLTVAVPRSDTLNPSIRYSTVNMEVMWTTIGPMIGRAAADCECGRAFCDGWNFHPLLLAWIENRSTYYQLDMCR